MKLVTFGQKKWAFGHFCPKKWAENLVKKLNRSEFLGYFGPFLGHFLAQYIKFYIFLRVLVKNPLFSLIYIRKIINI